MGKSQITSCSKSQEPLSLPDPDKVPCRFFLVADDTGSLARSARGRQGGRWGVLPGLPLSLLRPRRRLLCTCSCNLKWHFAIVMAHASYVLFLLSVPAAVISNGNYTRHFRRNWDLFRSLGTLRGAVTRCNGYLRRPTRVTRRTASKAYTSRRLRESPEHCEQVPLKLAIMINYVLPFVFSLLTCPRAIPVSLQ